MLFWQDPRDSLKLRLVVAYRNAERETFPYFQKLCNEYSRGEFILHRWEQLLKWVKLHEEGLFLLVFVKPVHGTNLLNRHYFIFAFFSDCVRQIAAQSEA